MYSIRSAEPSDVSVLVQLVNSSYRGDFAKKGWTTEADILGGQRVDAEGLLEKISSKNSKVFVAENSQKEIVACVHVESTARGLYLGMLTVNPLLQNQGLGKKLVHFVENWSLENTHLSEIWMSVIDSRNELIAWYERLGFVKTGEREAFPMDNPRFGIPKVAHLEFVILSKKISNAN